MFVRSFTTTTLKLLQRARLIQTYSENVSVKYDTLFDQSKSLPDRSSAHGWGCCSCPCAAAASRRNATTHWDCWWITNPPPWSSGWTAASSAPSWTQTGRQGGETTSKGKKNAFVSNVVAGIKTHFPTTLWKISSSAIYRLTRKADQQNQLHHCVYHTNECAVPLLSKMKWLQEAEAASAQY